MANVGMLYSRTSAEATSSWVESGFEAHSAIDAPPSRKVIIRLAVSVVTCRQAATRIPASGWVLMNCLRIAANTGIDWAAHSMRRFPTSASERSFTSPGTVAVTLIVFSPNNELVLCDGRRLRGLLQRRGFIRGFPGEGILGA